MSFRFTCGQVGNSQPVVLPNQDQFQKQPLKTELGTRDVLGSISVSKGMDMWFIVPAKYAVITARILKFFENRSHFGSASVFLKLLMHSLARVDSHVFL